MGRRPKILYVERRNSLHQGIIGVAADANILSDRCPTSGSALKIIACEGQLELWFECPFCGRSISTFTGHP